MKTMKWLIRREFWEHKGSFFWAPLIVAAIMSVFILGIVSLGVSADNIRGTYGEVNDTQVSMSTLAAQVSDAQKAQLANTMANAYMFVTAPLFIVLSFIVFFYCLSSLYEERRDRSILFWKSLPVSDGMTVLSKLMMAAGVAPLITIAVATVTSLLVLLMFCAALAFKGINVFGLLLSTPALYAAPFQLLGMLPIYLLWALPTIGWLLMVSAWARSKVFLWAVGVPCLSMALLVWAERLFNFQWNIVWYAKNIVARLLLGVIPGGWVSLVDLGNAQIITQHRSGVEMSGIFTQSWATLAYPELWIGVAAGVAMIYVAIRLRRWRE
ncbi:hypothetical protein [Solimicrobium silvestre]|uniref:ABC-2 family transporter protein n=1 Tax=Solimicrobium silvestre TaxID=2099400 RepID=A0A2S9GW96_9BURK|nr:hypothetical protein [Solimicrobium silvestre]PRC92005.1 hypothetical protein S2091_3347 [Solimicrobium silvestre]